MNEKGTPPLLISVLETARLLSVGKNTAYELISSGTLPSIKLGRRRLVSVAALTAWVAQQSQVESPDAAVVSLRPPAGEE